MNKYVLNYYAILLDWVDKSRKKSPILNNFVLELCRVSYENYFYVFGILYDEVKRKATYNNNKLSMEKCIGDELVIKTGLALVSPIYITNTPVQSIENYFYETSNLNPKPVFFPTFINNDVPLIYDVFTSYVSGDVVKNASDDNQYFAIKPIVIPNTPFTNENAWMKINTFFKVGGFDNDYDYIVNVPVAYQAGYTDYLTNLINTLNPVGRRYTLVFY